jgi:UDP-sulfoquinovose synthase
LRPHCLSDSLLDSLMNIAIRYQDRINTSLFLPQVKWQNSHNEISRPLATTALATPGGD